MLNGKAVMRMRETPVLVAVTPAARLVQETPNGKHVHKPEQ